MTGILTEEKRHRLRDTERMTMERWRWILELLCHKLRNIWGHQKLEEAGKAPLRGFKRSTILPTC